MLRRLFKLVLICLCLTGYSTAEASYPSPSDPQKAMERYLCESEYVRISTTKAAMNGFMEGMNMPVIAIQKLSSMMIGSSLRNNDLIQSQDAIEREKISLSGSSSIAFNANMVAFATGKALNPILLTIAYYGEKANNFAFLSRIKLPSEYIAGVGMGLAVGLANSIVDNYDSRSNTINLLGMISELIGYGCIGLLANIIVATLRRYAGGILKYSFLLCFELTLPVVYRRALYRVFTLIVCMVLINICSPLLNNKSEVLYFSSLSYVMNNC